MKFCPLLILTTCLLLFQVDSYSTEASEAALRKHVDKLTAGPGFRNHTDTVALNRTAEYIYKEFSELTKETYTQAFTAMGKKYYNVYATFGPVNAPRIIIGAHYDVYGEQMGADDNASGVAGLLELARMFSETDISKWEVRIDLVAYSLEEPPYFGSQDMGSKVHATALHTNNTPVVGMVSLEMIGFFDDRRQSQQYPTFLSGMLRRHKGNFIAVVHKPFAGKFARMFTKEFTHGKAGVPTKIFRSGAWTKTVDMQSHKNYTHFKWPSVLVTNSTRYRNLYYHTQDDKPETLDYFRMSSVVTKVYKAITALTS